MTENSEAASALIDAYLQRRGLSEASGHDRATKVLVYDRRYRIELSATRQGAVMVRGRLMILPSAGPQRDAAVLRCCRIALWSASRSSAFCAVDAQARAVWLQCLIAPMHDGAGAAATGLSLPAADDGLRGTPLERQGVRDADVDVLARALGGFIDVFARWRDILARPEAADVERLASRIPASYRENMALSLATGVAGMR